MDKQWFSDRVREQETAMYALSMSYMKQEADALDCMQQSILKAYESLGTLRDPEKFRSWLFGILVNCCRDELRRRQRTRTEEDLPDRAVPEAPVSEETRLVLWNAVRTLPEPYRIELMLFYYEDVPTDEIAEILALKPATVRKHLERGRELLRLALEKEGFQNDG